jgi:hypothetical protein
LLANVIGNLALIRVRRVQGAALSTLATEIVVSIGCVIALARLRGPHVVVGCRGHAIAEAVAVIRMSHSALERVVPALRSSYAALLPTTASQALN